MRRLAFVGLLSIALSGLLPGLVAAAPSGGIVETVMCDDGSSFDVNFGALPNQSSTGFTGKNTVFVAKHFEILVDGEVVYGWDRGIDGFSGAALLTCTGDLDGAVFVLVGYLTPRGA
jgi:hypothetical protein